MSDNEKKTQKNTAGTQEPVVTRYDLKMQRRKEQKRKEQRDKRIAQVAGIIVLIGFICWLISFPIRSWLTVHGTYIVVADENVSRVEFDYNYYTVLNNYMSTNSYFLSLMGLDLSGDLSTQMYSETLTWQDYFEEMAVNNLLTGIAMRRDMEAAGFTYDESAQYESFVALLEQAAKESGVSFKEYIREFYGPYATLDRVEEYIRENLKTSAYLEAVAENRTPSDADIQAYYEENKNSYDYVDYHMFQVDAELPTEPTELADPVEETDEAAFGDGEDTAYTPSQAEIDAAMAIAKAEAEALLDTVATEGEVYTDWAITNLNNNIMGWISDSERKKGDTTVIENPYSHCYYVVSFDNRYIDPEISVNVRAVLTEDGNGQEILDEWAAGEATENSFASLADRYNDPMYLSAEGGLIEGIDARILEKEMADWLTDEARVYGDTTVITTSDASMTYVFYYIGVGDPVWKVNIRNFLLNDIKTEYVSSLTEGLTVADPHHHLHYLEVRAQEDAAAAADGDGAAESDTTGDGTTEDGASEDSSVG